ncbi:peptidyl-prolyl cis-trans isomerase [bacterium]|nr:peptidyl-prolyl cis-trans isomerase [bacterium]
MKFQITSYLLLIFSSAVVNIACNAPENKFIAKIGNAELTETVVDSALRTDIRLQEEARQDYIQNWINSESLYQKAIREGYDKDPSYQRQVENMRRELLIQSFIENEIEKNVTITPKESEDYYAQNRNSFVYPEDHVKVQYFLTLDKLRSKKMASEFLSMSRLRKKDFMELVSQAAADSDIVGATDFQTRNKFEDRVAKQVFLKNATDEIIGPILTRHGYYSFWYVVEIRPKGTYKPFSEVSLEIESRLKVIKRKQKTKELMDKTRQEMNIEYRHGESSRQK